MSLLRRVLSMEEHSDGKSFQEIEHVYYGKLVDILVLSKATSKEYQEQYQIKIPKTDDNEASGNMRIRKTIPNVTDIDKTDYVLTTKIKSEHGKTSTPIPATEDAFKQFKLLSDSGMRKDRYHFPVEDSDLVFEVDLFYLPDAEIGSCKYSEWVKIDLELPGPDTPIPPLPFELSDSIMSQASERSEEDPDSIKIQKLYDEIFRNC